MTLDMRPMLRGEVNRIDVDYMLSPEPISSVTFGGDAHVVGAITNEAGYMRLTLQAQLNYQGECARCLSLVSGVFSLEFERTVANEGMLTDEQLEDNVDEYVIIENGKLDLDEELREALILAFPMRLLCEEDCPGLCPKCGKPRREGTCNCPTREIDPRLAILGTLLENNDDEKEENK
ncbi:MAG: DUF177 domain-containing protein [Clostridia bacterium]|nr:DUF177 domain-containing protein [Clostridia bacterium]MBR5797686.1 DUF177 domain-containing protein [Clostridia bacterium]